MQNGYAKTYLYVVATIASINFILGLVYLFTKIPALWAPLLVSSLVELIVLIMSIIMIVKVFTRKLNRINLVIPVVYLVTMITLWGYGLLAGPDTSNLSLKDAVLSDFDISVLRNFIMIGINMVLYVFLIGFSMYLLRNDEFFRQGDE